MNLYTIALATAILGLIFLLWYLARLPRIKEKEREAIIKHFREQDTLKRNKEFLEEKSKV